jgi:hypothetical protein
MMKKKAYLIGILAALLVIGGLLTTTCSQTTNSETNPNITGITDPAADPATDPATDPTASENRDPTDTRDIIETEPGKVAIYSKSQGKAGVNEITDLSGENAYIVQVTRGSVSTWHSLSGEVPAAALSGPLSLQAAAAAAGTAGAGYTGIGNLENDGAAVYDVYRVTNAGGNFKKNTVLYHSAAITNLADIPEQVSVYALADLEVGNDAVTLEGTLYLDRALKLTEGGVLTLSGVGSGTTVTGTGQKIKAPGKIVVGLGADSVTLTNTEIEAFTDKTVLDGVTGTVSILDVYKEHTGYYPNYRHDILTVKKDGSVAIKGSGAVRLGDSRGGNRKDVTLSGNGGTFTPEPGRFGWFSIDSAMIWIQGNMVIGAGGIVETFNHTGSGGVTIYNYGSIKVASGGVLTIGAATTPLASPKGYSLTFGIGTTLTNEGVITLRPEGRFAMLGTDAAFINKGTFNNGGDIDLSGPIVFKNEGRLVFNPTATFSPSYCCVPENTGIVEIQATGAGSDAVLKAAIGNTARIGYSGTDKYRGFNTVKITGAAPIFDGVTVPAGANVEIAAGTNAVVTESATLTVEGKITVHGALDIRGARAGAGTIE